MIGLMTFYQVVVKEAKNIERKSSRTQNDSTTEDDDEGDDEF